MSTPYSASIIVSAAGNGQAGVTVSPGGLPGPQGLPGPPGAGLTPTAVKTSAYLAVPSDFVPVDTTSGAVTITLPAAPADQAVIGVKMVKQGGTNAVTVAAGGSDRFNITGGASALSLSLLFQGTEIQYDHAAALWYVIADDLALGSLDGRYTQDAGDLGGTTTSPQVIGTHLASPLPLAQGGTNAASAPAALTSLGAASAAALTAETTRAEAAEALLAPLASPALTGSPTAPTKAPLTDNTDIATTAYADLAVGVETARAEAAETLLAPLASPALTGSPTAPTKTALTSNTDIATTAYADSAVAVETSRAEAAEALKAPLASPALTGSPTAPTKSALTSNTDIATTAYADSAVAVETSRAEAAEVLLAPLASPALTGSPTAPTKAALTSNTDIATTAYADSAVAVETSRAETAEALALPKTGGTMSGAIAMGTSKITGLGNGSGAQDAAAFGQTPAGGNTVTIAEGGTGQVTAAAAYNALSPMTTTGDIEYESGTGTAARLAGNTTATKKFLTGTGTGSAAQAPAWATIVSGDVPTLNQNTSGTASNITDTLDQVPAAAASVNLNSQKITSLANGSASSDAAAFGQLPSSGTPLALSKGGTGVSAASDSALLTDLGALAAANNLSDLGSASTARTNLGILGNGAVSPLLASLGYVGTSGDPSVVVTTAPSNGTWASGAMTLIPVYVTPGVTVNGYITAYWTIASGLVNTYFGVYSTAGTQLGVTSDLSSTAAGVSRVALTGWTTAPSNGLVYVVYLNGTQGGANGPRFVTNTFEAAFTSSAMLPSQAALPYYGAQKTGSLTSLPGSITLSQFSYFRITPLILLD